MMLTEFKKTIFKVVDKLTMLASINNLERGRLLVIEEDGKMRLKIGKGNTSPKNLNYIGEAIYSSSEPTTIDAFGIPKNTVLTGKSADEILQMMLNVYQKVVLNSISISPNEREVGNPLNISMEFTFSISNAANLRAENKCLISSPANSNVFVNPATKQTIQLNGLVSNGIANTVFTATIYGKENEVSTRTATLPWKAKMYWGSSLLTNLTTKDQVVALQNNALTQSRNGTFTFPAGYAYLVYPKVLSLSGIGFTDIDVATGKELLGYAMTKVGDLVFSNGFIDLDHAIYRSVYAFGGTTKCKVS